MIQTNIYNKKLQELDSEYYSAEEICKFSEKLNIETFLIFNLNIRSLNKHIDKLNLRFSKEKFGVLTIAPEENCPRLGLRLGLGLVLELGSGAIFLGGNCSRTGKFSVIVLTET